MESEIEKQCTEVELKLKQDHRYRNSIHHIINDPELFSKAVQEGTIAMGTAIPSKPKPDKRCQGSASSSEDSIKSDPSEVKDGRVMKGEILEARELFHDINITNIIPNPALEIVRDVSSSEEEDSIGTPTYGVVVKTNCPRQQPIEF